MTNQNSYTDASNIAIRDLHDSEVRYQQLISLVPDGVVVYVDRKIALINEPGARIVGAESPEVLLGRDLMEFVHPDYQELIRERIKQLNEKGLPAPLIEQKLVRLDGQVVEVDAVSNSIYYKGKRAIQTIFRELTARKRAEKEIQETEEKYRTLIEQMPAIAYILEFEGEKFKVNYISPQVETILGLTQDEWINTPDIIFTLVHPEDRDYLADKHSHRHISGVDSLSGEYRLVARDGRVVWIRNQTRYTRDENGRLLYSHGVMFDITEQKALEEQFLQAQKMEAVGQLAGGIAHNFNNVLTALIGHTELALQAISEEHQVHDDLESIRKNAQRAAGLVQQLLAFTRRHEPHLEILSLNSLVADIYPMLRQLISEVIELKLDKANDLAQVRADPVQIEQVLVNLIVNARDAMPDGGRLTIQTANATFNEAYITKHARIKPGRYVMLAITDTGLGIRPEILAHIFEPFFTTKTVDKGTGLGLSTCFGIVRQHNGQIIVDSSPGYGTTFKVYLPQFVDQPCESTIES